MPDIEQSKGHSVPERAPLSEAARTYAAKIGRDFDTLTPELQQQRFEELKYQVLTEDPEAEDYTRAQFLHDIGKSDTPALVGEVPAEVVAEVKSKGVVPENLPVAEAVVPDTSAPDNTSPDTSAAALPGTEGMSHLDIAQARRAEIVTRLDEIKRGPKGKSGGEFTALMQELSEVDEFIKSLRPVEPRRGRPKKVTLAVATEKPGAGDAAVEGALPEQTPPVTETVPDTDKAPEQEIMSSRIFTATEASAGHPDHNEDRLVSIPEVSMAGVLDGMGGHAGGEVAAETARGVIEKYFQSNLLILNSETAGEQLRRALIAANEAVKKVSVQDFRGETIGAAATLSIIVNGAHGPELFVATMGDTRAWLSRNGQLEQLTTDNLSADEAATKPAMISARRNLQRRLGAVTHDEITDPLLASQFDHRNRISHYLGETNPSPHLVRQVLQPGDRIILTSDGIHDNLTDEEIRTILAQPDEEGKTVADRLLAAAKQRSQDSIRHKRAKEDDMTAVLVVPEFPSVPARGTSKADTPTAKNQAGETLHADPIVPAGPVPGVSAADLAAGIARVAPTLSEPVRADVQPTIDDLLAHGLVGSAPDVPPGPRVGPDSVAGHVRDRLDTPDVPAPTAPPSPDVPSVSTPDVPRPLPDTPTHSTPDVVPKPDTVSSVVPPDSTTARTRAAAKPKPDPAHAPIVDIPVTARVPLDRMAIHGEQGNLDFRDLSDDQLAQESVRLQHALFDSDLILREGSSDVSQTLGQTLEAINTEMNRRGIVRIRPEIEKTRRDEGKIVDREPLVDTKLKGRTWNTIGKWKEKQLQEAKTDVEAELLNPDHKPGSLRDTILQQRRQQLVHAAAERKVDLAWSPELPPYVERTRTPAEMALLAAEAKVTKLRGTQRKFLHAAKKSDIAAAEQELFEAKGKAADEQLALLLAKYDGQDPTDPKVAKAFAADFVAVQLKTGLDLQIAGYSELGRPEQAGLLKGTGPLRMGVGFAAALLASAAKWTGHDVVAEGMNAGRGLTTGVGVTTGVKGLLKGMGKFFSQHFGDSRSFTREEVARMSFAEKNKYYAARLADTRENGGVIGTETRGSAHKTEDRTMEYLGEGIEQDRMEMAIEGIVEMATRGIPINEIVASRNMSDMAVEHRMGETLEGHLIRLKVASATQTVASVAVGLLATKAVIAGAVTTDLAKWVAHAFENPGEAIQEVGKNIVNAPQTIWEGMQSVGKMVGHVATHPVETVHNIGHSIADAPRVIADKFHPASAAHTSTAAAPPAVHHLTREQLADQQQATETARLGGAHLPPPGEAPHGPIDSTGTKLPNLPAGSHPTNIDHPLPVPGTEVHAGLPAESVVEAQSGDNVTKILEHQLERQLGTVEWNSLGHAGQDVLVNNVLLHANEHGLLHIPERLDVGDQVDISHVFAGKESFDLHAGVVHAHLMTEDPHTAGRVLAQRAVLEHFRHLHPDGSFDANQILAQQHAQVESLTTSGEQALREAATHHATAAEAQQATLHSMHSILEQAPAHAAETATHGTAGTDVHTGAEAHTATPSEKTVPAPNQIFHGVRPATWHPPADSLADHHAATSAAEAATRARELAEKGYSGTNVISYGQTVTPVHSSADVHSAVVDHHFEDADSVVTSHTAFETGRATHEMATSYRDYQQLAIHVPEVSQETFRASLSKLTLAEAARSGITIPQIEYGATPNIYKDAMPIMIEKMSRLLLANGFNPNEKLSTAIEWLITHRE